MKIADLLGREPFNESSCPRCGFVDPFDWRPREGRCCKRCGCDRVGRLVVSISANAVRTVRQSCSACGYRSGEALSYKTLPPGTDVAALPVVEDHRTTAPCARCGSTNGVELHHWAPWHLFKDAHKWPTAWLCTECHRLWHSVVTPNMSQRSA